MQEMSSLAQRGVRGFLAIPPFPAALAADFGEPPTGSAPIGDEEADRLLAALSTHRVGGCTWGPQSALEQGYRLVRSRREPQPGDRRSVWWGSQESSANAGAANGAMATVPQDSDPWHLLEGADELVCSEGDKAALLIAGLTGVPVALLERPGTAAAPVQAARCRHLLRDLVLASYTNPFTGALMSPGETIELCAFWRRLIDSNRDLAAIYGFARWKRPTTAPLLWGGKAIAFDRSVLQLRPGETVGLWRSRVSKSRLRQLADRRALTVEIEDGFIRSAGLGADCVPPQSIVVDRLGVHFDARKPSDLECLLGQAELSSDLLARAAALSSRIVALGLSKYDIGQEPLERRSAKRHILVLGQVEDDRAVLEAAGGMLSNAELLRRVRSHEPDAYILYKPHPDVEAGHRKGAIADRAACLHADEVVRTPSISSWIDLVDEVHVNSSLAGFEALMRGKDVTTYGVPFYAGWGLTCDRGPVPARRNRKRSLDELVAICLLLYPRYVDPRTNLPCPPEVLIDRLADPQRAAGKGFLVALRRTQGWLRTVPNRLGRPRR
jgi:capsular polysaccharide export protein